jgi:hypothetical protein
VQYYQLKRRHAKIGCGDIIEFDTFVTLVKSPCKYCGVEYSKRIEDRPKKKLSDHILTCNGIDRLDPSIGYTKDNSVACCTCCNFAKHIMTETEFYRWVNRVYNYCVKDKVLT